MNEQENLEVVRRSIDAFSRGDAEATAANFAEGGEYVELATGQTCRGRAELVAIWRGWLTAFPDAKGEVKRAAAQGDQVAVEVTWRGTQTGPLRGPAGTIPATGRFVETPAAVFFTVRDGKIQSERQYFDMASLLRQLGVGS